MATAFDLSAALATRHASGRYRRRDTHDGPSGRELCVDGQRLLNFAGNDYLGLANHPEVVQALRDAASEQGVGSGAAHLVCGHSRYHQQLEGALATFCRRPRALLFSTGYMANLGVIQALIGRADAVFEDRLNHASLIDGGLASGARLRRYRHADSDHLGSLLGNDAQQRRLVISDGVFSMDGDVAPLPALIAQCNAHQAWLMIDDAHGFGVLGEQGAGCVAGGPYHDQVPILIGTLGKALGTFGAFVAGSDELIETVMQFARPYIYTTALPPALAAATLASLRRVQADQWRRDKLGELIARFRERAQQRGLSLLPSSTPIQPLLIGDDVATVERARQLRERGFLVGAIRPPTVPEGGARLRITLSAAHEVADIDQLLDALCHD